MVYPRRCSVAENHPTIGRLPVSGRRVGDNRSRGRPRRGRVYRSGDSRRTPGAGGASKYTGRSSVPTAVVVVPPGAACRCGPTRDTAWGLSCLYNDVTATIPSVGRPHREDVTTSGETPEFQSPKFSVGIIPVNLVAERRSPGVNPLNSVGFHGSRYMFACAADSNSSCNTFKIRVIQLIQTEIYINHQYTLHDTFLLSGPERRVCTA